MSDAEYQDRQALETEIKDYAKQVENLGEQQKDHQEDLIKLQKTMLKFKSSKGFDKVADSKVIQHLETAIATRESSIETCKENLAAVKRNMEATQTKLEETISIREEKLKEAEQVKNTLNHENKALETAIQQQKDDISDVKKKTKSLGEVIKDSITLITAGAIAVKEVVGVVEKLRQIFNF